MSEPILSDNPEAMRFEALVDGVVAGFAEYQLTDQQVVFTHTLVDPAFEGQGVGSALARYALDQIRADGARTAVAVCPFIKRWIRRHPEYLGIASEADSSDSE